MAAVEPERALERLGRPLAFAAQRLDPCRQVVRGPLVAAPWVPAAEDEATSIIASAPSETEPSRTLIVRGMVKEGSNALFAWVTCIPF